MHQYSPIRVGIVGTGVMGGHHTRVASTMPQSHLIGIFDPDTARATQIASQFGVSAFESLEALCSAVDAVIIASPTFTHAKVAATCLQAGCHVLLEKPIAATVAEGEQLVELSHRLDHILMIGHLERYNPAVTTVLSLMNRHDLFAVEFQRLSPTPGRDRSADIIFDLMIHDIDLALAFGGCAVKSVSAVGHRAKYDFIDHVTALLRFENGVTVTLTASAVSNERRRIGQIFTREAQFSLDLANREVWTHRFGQSTLATPEGQKYQASQVEQIYFPNREPLAIEQEHFYQSISQKTAPQTTADSGLQVLRLAQQIQDKVNEQLLTLA
ncbi:MAG TPA: Gfo/Idh/MocA family oxidoreductase [Armatimonadota bacterium]|nr:Gfo/Idh/MocA family oxidoreductase [Armatimonadota bacterium]